MSNVFRKLRLLTLAIASVFIVVGAVVPQNNAQAVKTAKEVAIEKSASTKFKWDSATISKIQNKTFEIEKGKSFVIDVKLAAGQYANFKCIAGCSKKDGVTIGNIQKKIGKKKQTIGLKVTVDGNNKNLLNGKKVQIEIEAKDGSGTGDTIDTTFTVKVKGAGKVVVEQAQGTEDYQGIIGAFLPACADKGSCRDVTVFVVLLINIVEFLFGIIGSIALVMFMIGGFTMIFSAGSPDKVNKGKAILTNAIIGLVIAFSAYLIIDFILDAFQVADSFRAIG